MLKKLLIILVLFFVSAHQAYGCVGRILTIGSVDSPAGRVMTETLALLIIERTGTTVHTKYFNSTDDLYTAIRADEVGIFVENSSRALKILGLPEISDHEKAYLQIKETYRKDMDLIWLNPFHFLNANSSDQKSATSTVLSLSVMTDFPGLLRLLNKLSKKVDDQVYAELVKRANSGKKPTNIAKDFLEAKKLI